MHSTVHRRTQACACRLFSQELQALAIEILHQHVRELLGARTSEIEPPQDGCCIGLCCSNECLPLFGGQEDSGLSFVLYIIRERVYAPGGRVPTWPSSIAWLRPATTARTYRFTVSMSARVSS